MKEEYVNKLLKLDENLINLFTDIFYYKDNSVFNKKEQQEVDVNTFIERNLKGTNVLRYSKDFCSIFFLQKCYYNLCMKLLKNNEVYIFHITFGIKLKPIMYLFMIE